MKFRTAAFAVLFTVSLLAQPAEVEITGEPLHHLTMQNDYVRVFNVELPPHGSTLLHRHRHDYFIVALTASDVISEVQGKPPASIRMKAGDVRFATGNFVHIARNQADASFPHLDIEVLQPKTYTWDEGRGVSVLEGGTHEILFVKDGIRASEVELQPHAMIPKHTHTSPHLVIALNDFELETQIEGKPAKRASLKAGQSAWVESGITHTVMNVSHGNAKFVTLEFPPSAK